MTQTPQEIESWLCKALAKELECPAESLGLDKPFAELGIDSGALLGISGDLEEFLDVSLDPTVVFEYPTIAKLTDFLSKEV